MIEMQMFKRTASEVRAVQFVPRSKDDFEAYAETYGEPERSYVFNWHFPDRAYLHLKGEGFIVYFGQWIVETPTGYNAMADGPFRNTFDTTSEVR